MMRKVGIKYIKIIVNLLVALCLVGLGFYVLPKLIGFFLPILIGVAIGALASPVVAFLESKIKLHRKMGSMLIILFVLTIVGLGFYWALALLIRQLIHFLKDLPQIVNAIEGVRMPSQLNKVYLSLPKELQHSLQHLINDSLDEIGKMSGEITPYVADKARTLVNNIPIVLIYIIFSLLCAYFFVVDREKIIKKYRELCPHRLQKAIGYVYDMLTEILGGYFRAQLKLMGLVSFVLMVCFFILKIRYALILALFISVLDALPFLGTGTVLIPWAVWSTMNGNYILGVGLLITYVLTQVLRRILEPKFVADGIGIHPFVAVIYMFIGFRLKGILGMIVAVPLGMIIMTILDNGFLDRPVKIGKSVLSDIYDFCRIDEIDSKD